MKLYFAHPVNVYDTPLEQALLRFIKHKFPEDTVENPNQPHHQVGYREYAERFKHEPVAKGTRGMRYYHEVVLPGCGGCVALPFLDGRIGLGAADEPRWYLEHRMPAWFIEPRREATKDDLRQFINDPTTSDLFRVRPFNKREIEMLCNVDPETGSPLVVSHQETRLRTWMVYNRVRRPYEKAHLVQMPVPPGFYPEDEKK